MMSQMAGRSQTRELDSDLHILEQRIHQQISHGMDSTIDVVSNIAEYCEDDEKLKQDVRNIMAEFVQMETKVKQYVKALNHVKSTGDREAEGPSLGQVFETKMEQLRSKGEPDVTRHPKYAAMEEEFDNCGDIEAQLESLRSTLVGETEDEDVALTQVEVNMKCPYTGQTMVDPVRNSVCNHVYDRDGIMGHIHHKKGRAKCPVGGCVNPEPIQAQHLIAHTDLKRYIKLMSKRHQ